MNPWTREEVEELPDIPEATRFFREGNVFYQQLSGDENQLYRAIGVTLDPFDILEADAVIYQGKIVAGEMDIQDETIDCSDMTGNHHVSFNHEVETNSWAYLLQYIPRV